VPRRLSSGVLAVGCALAIAACGGSGTGSSADRASGYPQALAYADCVRSHGVPNFPDPSPTSGFHIPSTINTQSPAYVSAQRTCSKLLPPPVGPHTPTSERLNRQWLAAAKCMRAHGVNLADPIFNGATITLDLADQSTIQSPAFKHAEHVCHYPLPMKASGSAASP
jgi:hypothetical protein